MERGEMRHRESDVNEKWDVSNYAAINEMLWMDRTPLKGTC